MGLRDWFGEHEKAAVFFVVGLLITVNAIAFGMAFGLIGGSRYESISTSYVKAPDGLKVTEQFVQTVSVFDSFRVLYRSFYEPICLSVCQIRIQSVQCAHSKPYINGLEGLREPDTKEKLYLDDLDIERRIKSNEVGCYSGGFAGTTEEFNVTYIVSTDTVILNNYQHSLFSNNHPPIISLEARGTEKSSSRFLILANTQVLIDTRSGDIKGGSYLIFIIPVLFMLFPLIAYFIWGRDPEDVVPHYLHTVPNQKREPWEADIIVNGKPRLSNEGLGSIILSLYIKGIATVEVEKSLFKKKLIVTVQKNPKETPTATEDKLLHVLMKEKREETKTYSAYEFDPTRHYGEMGTFMGSSDVKKIYKDNYEGFGSTLVFSTVFIIWVIVGIIGNIFSVSFFIVLIVVNSFVMFLANLLIPPSVFSRFKPGQHREYLEWLSFKQMLTDYAQIQRYLKEDYRQWRQWIAYATALGAAGNLLKSMKELKIINPEQYETISGVNMAAAAAIYMPSSSGSGGGFGGGGGGGFGGGGGGGR